MLTLLITVYLYCMYCLYAAVCLPGCFSNLSVLLFYCMSLYFYVLDPRETRGTSVCV